MARFFSYDLNSPYVYLAAHRVDDLVTVEWCPIAFGPLLVATGRVPWSLTPGERDAGMRECAARAAGVERIDTEIADPALEQELRDRTDAAIAAGVVGVPTLELKGRLSWGDDRLEEGAAA